MARGNFRTVENGGAGPDDAGSHEDVVELLRQVGQRLMHSERERRELRRTLEDIAEKADQGERAYLTIQDRLNKTESLMEKRQKALEKTQKEQMERIEKAAAMADRIEEAIAQHEKIARRLDRVMQDKARMIRKLERIEEAVIETQDVVRSNSRELSLPSAAPVIADAPAAPAAGFAGGAVAKTPAPARAEEEEAAPLWRQNVAVRVTAIAAMIVLGVAGGLAIGVIRGGLPDRLPGASLHSPAAQEPDIAALSPAATADDTVSDLSVPPSDEVLAAADVPAPVSPDSAQDAPASDVPASAAEETETPEAENAPEADVMKMDDAELLSRMKDDPDALAAQLNDISPSAAASLIDAVSGGADDAQAQDISVPAAFAGADVPAAPVSLKPQKKAEEPVETFLKAQADARPLRERIAEDKTLPPAIGAVQKKAFEGVAEAQHDLAAIYTAGHAGVAVDYAKAAQWFKEASLNGVANARYNLGVLYHQGMGVEKDIDRAVKWYRAAAEMGHPEAQYNLAIAYIEGVGMPYDPEKAAFYFEKAAEKGIMEAAYNLGLIHENALTGQGHTDEALYWYKRAADLGSPEGKAAMDQLARTLGLTPNEVEKFYESIAQKKQAAAPAPVKEKAAEARPRSAPPPPPHDAAPVEEPPSSSANANEKKAGIDYIEAQPLDAAPSAAPPLAAAQGGDVEKNQAVIAQIQEQLIRMGFYPGPADGVMDSLTGDAIRAYQVNYSLAADGRPSQALLVHMMTSDLSGGESAGESGSRDR